MNEENKNKGIFSEDIIKAVAIAIVIIVIFSIGNIVGIVIGTDNNSEDYIEGADAPSSDSVTVSSTTQAVTTTVPAAPQQQTTTATSSGNTQTTAPSTSSSGSMSTAEIISLFNESANRVKTDASKVVKNFENRTHNEEHLIVPSVVEGMAASLLEENFKDDTEPIEYATREDIKAQYQVPGVEWASQLTEAEVASASCTDNGSEYEVSITLHPTENPEPGVGVAKAFDTITSSEVMEKAPSFVTGFTTNYTDCIVKCKIDKATGRTTWSNYTSTVILGVELTFLGSDLNAQVGMTFEKDYTISY